MSQRPPHYSSSTDRAPEVWRRLIGLFGGDSVRRKYGDTPPTEWASVIAKLNDYDLERGMRRLVHSGRGHVPSLPEFVKLCRTVGQADDVPDAPQNPQLSAPDDGRFDDWAMTANRHLLAYVFKHTALRTRRYAPGWTSGGGVVTPGPESRARTAVLVKWKNEWAARMRAAADEHGVNVEDQRDIWANCMALAEAELDAMAQRQAA
jgi:hypothetical protein